MNTQDKQKNFMDTDYSMVVIGGKEGWREVAKVKGVKCMVTEGDLWLLNTQCNTQIIYYIIESCTGNLTNATLINLIEMLRNKQKNPMSLW